MYYAPIESQKIVPKATCKVNGIGPSLSLNDPAHKEMIDLDYTLIQSSKFLLNILQLGWLTSI